MPTITRQQYLVPVLGKVAYNYASNPLGPVSGKMLPCFLALGTLGWCSAYAPGVKIFDCLREGSLLFVQTETQKSRQGLE